MAAVFAFLQHSKSKIIYVCGCIQWDIVSLLELNILVDEDHTERKQAMLEFACPSKYPFNNMYLVHLSKGIKTNFNQI